jgi:hypothetical protein
LAVKTPAPPGTTLEPGRASRPPGRSWEGELGANQEVLARLLERGAQAAIRVDRPHEELAGAIAAEGPYDLVVDYLWGAPAEAVFTALIRPAPRDGDARGASAPSRFLPAVLGSVGPLALAELVGDLDVHPFGHGCAYSRAIMTTASFSRSMNARGAGGRHHPARMNRAARWSGP